MTDREVPVLVVGAGLAGLSAATFVGLHGVAALVVERHATTSIHPKARGQFPHVMEALRVAGIDQKMVEAAPHDEGFRIVIAHSVAGPIFKEILVDATPDFGHLSTAGWANASQERAEPILAERARELGADISFCTELESFQHDADGVTAILRDLRTGELTTVRAGYLVAADGHRSPIRTALGIGVHGRGILGEGIGVVFEAGLTGKHGPHILSYLRNSALPGGGGVVVGTDVPDRYALGVGFDAASGDRVADFTERRWVELIRAATGIADLEPKLVECAPETTLTEHRVADRFSLGRVHLIGDAARVMPPTGAFGGNTAIMDGFALGWKLAMVVKGQAGPRLLDSHDPERRPYSDIIAEQQYARFIERMRPDLADQSVAAPLEPMSMAFFGCRAVSDAVVREASDDGAPLENPERPTGRPGSRAPHVPLLRDGSPVSTVDLFGRSFVLLVGAAGKPWLAEAERAGQLLGIEMPVHRIGVDLLDQDGLWAKTYGVTEAGAVLVRPDFFVAWRSKEAGRSGDLARALRAILDRTDQ